MTIAKKTNVLSNTIESEIFVKTLNNNKNNNTMALLTNSRSSSNNINDNILANGWSLGNGSNNNNHENDDDDGIWKSTKLPVASSIKNRHKYDKLLPNTTKCTRVNKTNGAHDNDADANEKNIQNGTNTNSRHSSSSGSSCSEEASASLTNITWPAAAALATKLSPLASLSTTATSKPTAALQRENVKNVRTSRHMKHKQQPYDANNPQLAAAATTTTTSNIYPNSSSSSSGNGSGSFTATTTNNHHHSAQKLLKLPHNNKLNSTSTSSSCSSSNSSSNNNNMHFNNSKYFGNVYNDGSNQSSKTSTTTTASLTSCHNTPPSKTLTTASSPYSPYSSSLSSATSCSSLNSATTALLATTPTTQQQQNSITFGGLLRQQHQPLLATSSNISGSMELPTGATATTTTTSAATTLSYNNSNNYEAVNNVHNTSNTNSTNLYTNSNHHQPPSSNSSSNSSLYNNQYLRQSLLPSTSAASSSSSSSTTSSSTSPNCNCCSNLIARCCFGLPHLKAINVRRCVLALFAITVVTIFYYTHYMDTGVFVGLIQRDTRPTPIINCRMGSGKHTRNVSPAPDHRTEARLRIDPKVLVFVETTYSGLGRDIAELLVYNRIKYKIEVAGKSLPSLTNLDKGRYGVIVFENLDKYLHMDKWNRELLDKYCREYSVGIVGFVSPSEETLVAAQLKGFPLFVHTNLRLRDASLNPASPVLRLTRAGETAWGALPGDDWTVFQHNHSTYEPVEWAQRNSQDYPSDAGGQVHLPLSTVLQDHGQYDGIKRIFFGSSLKFWLHRLLFLDALSYLSHGQLSLNLERMILVDIDDIFVGEKGTRLRPDDVRALVATQKIIAGMVPGFRFNLGFSGKYYHHGTREENLGDDFLLQNVQEFNWFSHMWKHQQPHLYDNVTLLMSEMQLNHAFAVEHSIPTDSGYSISPHHSGVYPAHEILYEAWKKVWHIKVTSTEEYPHLRPARLRRGFIHRNIMVLPRQTCGLFTHTMYIDRYPGGRDKLDESIQGGELFQTIVYNPINIFMTHMSNYGSDRLALYTFQSVIKFLQCWTNLKLASAPPIQLAEMYFRLHPEEVDPIWGNPCDDPRHRKIWSKTKSCDSLPKFLVIGPQKTGTTALYTFLSMHSGIVSNIPSPDTYEEVQFFNGNNYYKGLDWYMDFFPAEVNTTVAPNSSPRYIFEKSATYFDGEMVPKRAHSLLPHSKIVTILISPAKRAYSWYQHQRAHGDTIANNYSFYQVITASDSAPKSLRDLRNRCLNPGKYAQHLERWLSYYPAQQLHLIDGEQLRLNPVDVMNDLQRFLKIQPAFDYSNQLRYDVKKGFFCQVVNEKRNKCLGKSKGRQYPPMDERSAKLLQRYYLSHNTALVKLLKKLGARPIPQWLKDDLSTST
ncbi:bifunctional heparan sulfate N-deacetylase/N-sulfotransferase [Calliphora vicina]|uniref:bifunctional heparan sulfate N-deacetylase/N-sulfotransferase n=1 Tax=Calliphora vicina TaxID=7373 RepID=UPI00325BE3B7